MSSDDDYNIINVNVNSNEDDDYVVIKKKGLQLGNNTNNYDYVDEGCDSNNYNEKKKVLVVGVEKDNKIKFEIVVVEDFDVAQALIDYTIHHRVENLFLGATSSSSNGFSRLFKKSSCCTPNTVLKWVPDFCNVYIISRQGKLSGVRNARCPLPIIPRHNQGHHRQTHHPCLGHLPHDMLVRRSSGDINSHDEIVSVAESDVSFVSSSQMSTTSSSKVVTMFNSFSSDFNIKINSYSSKSTCSLPPLDDSFLDKFSSVLACKARRRRCTPLLLTHRLKSMEDEMRRLKLEQNNNIS
ncbi:uncharacterized protein LOC133036069 [Cannabis sativa]|uniref:uncharacterized protein LOC133036069 n=1 Tax=Cannabis sativa TaxID=3483 RepID=UPI0029C9ED3E|nr:uncharacterized protein LOC133036069 [Cannabis sativa]